MTPQELVVLAKRIHDQEGYNLGAGSSREFRNEFWERVIGCAHHGHPTYNPTPDPRWHLKNGGPGRPQSDDVATILPSRTAWDFIGGVGANGYSFRVGEEFTLPPEQEVWKPKVPTGGGSTKPIDPPPPSQTECKFQPCSVPACDHRDVLEHISALASALTMANNTLDRVEARLGELEQRVTNAVKSQSYDISASSRFFGKFTGTITPSKEE